MTTLNVSEMMSEHERCMTRMNTYVPNAPLRVKVATMKQIRELRSMIVAASGVYYAGNGKFCTVPEE